MIEESVKPCLTKLNQLFYFSNSYQIYICMCVGGCVCMREWVLIGVLVWMYFLKNCSYLSTFSTHMHPGAMGMQMLPHGRIVFKHLCTTLDRKRNLQQVRIQVQEGHSVCSKYILPKCGNRWNFANTQPQ